MMNLLALSLVVTSLVTAGVLSPNPENQQNDNHGQDVIVKEGHRVVVVEYGDEGHHNTKVSISPEHGSVSDEDGKISNTHGVRENAEEKLREAASVLPNLGQGISSDEVSDGEKHGPRELICDAFGKCKHKIASVYGKAKEMVSDTVNEAVGDTFDKAKEKAHDVQEKAKGSVEKAKESVSGKAHDVKERAKESVEKISEEVSDKSHDVKESAKETVKKAKGSVREAKDVGKIIGEEAKETAERAADKAKMGAEKLKKQTHKGLGAIIHKMRNLLGTLPSMGELASLVSLLGFATAYGMSVWVTFISSYVLASVMPRQQFALVQSKIYPIYFKTMASSIGMALLGHLQSHTKRSLSNKAEMFQGLNLLAAFLLVVANSLYMEPRATKVMFEKIKAEKEEGRGREESTAEPSLLAQPGRQVPDSLTEPATPTVTGQTEQRVSSEQEEQRNKSKTDELNRKLKNLNAYSSFLNILTLMSLTWHLVYLNQRLHLAS